MLHLIIRALPKGVARLGFRLADRLRKPVYRLFKPNLRSVFVIGRSADGQVLMVRLSYGKGDWQFPGGGAKASEDLSHAARREFREETGCEAHNLAALATIDEEVMGTGSRSTIYLGMVEGEPCADGREIIEARFFSPDALPEPLSARTRIRLEMLARHDKATADEMPPA